MTEFEVFRRQVSPSIQEPAVTVQRDGVLLLNDAAYTELGAPEAVELLFARRERVMGLRAVDAGTPNAYRVRKTSGGPGVLVSGRAFTNYHRIPTTVARRYRAAMRDDVLIINLGEVLTERCRFVANSKPVPDCWSCPPEEPREHEKGL